LGKKPEIGNKKAGAGPVRPTNQEEAGETAK